MNDGEIIGHYFNRDERAIDETARKYGSRCLSVARNILGDPRDAEECVSSVSLLAWERIPPARPVRLGSWLVKLTRNLAFNRYKERKRLKRGGGETELVLDELAEVIPGDGDPASELELKELTAAVNSFLGSLSERERSIFMQRCFYAEPIKNIAARLAMTEGAVMTSLSRTRAKLKNRLINEGLINE